MVSTDGGSDTDTYVCTMRGGVYINRWNKEGEGRDKATGG